MTLVGQASKVSLLPQILPPFTGAETLYIIDQNGVSSKVALSDIAGIGIRQVKNNDVVPIPAGGVVAGNGVPGQVVLADDGSLALAKAVGIAPVAIQPGQLGLVQFVGYMRGLAGLTVGPQWLQGAGGIGPVPPSTAGLFITRLGDAISTTELILRIDYPNGPL